MANKPTGRVLADLSPENQALLARLMAGEDLAKAMSGSTKEPNVRVAEYTPKKGKDAGKPSLRLFIEGNFFPVILKQEQCKVLVEHGLDVLKRFAKEGK